MVFVEPVFGKLGIKLQVGLRYIPTTHKQTTMNAIPAFRANFDDALAEKLDITIEQKTKNNALFVTMLNLCIADRSKFVRSLIMTNVVTKRFHSDCFFKNKSLAQAWDLVSYVVDLTESLSEEQCGEVERFWATL